MGIYLGNTPINFTASQGVQSVWLGNNEVWSNGATLTYSGGSTSTSSEYLASYIVDENGNEYYGNESTVRLPLNTQLTIMGKSKEMPRPTRYMPVSSKFNDEYVIGAYSSNSTTEFVPILTFELIANTTIQLIYTTDTTQSSVEINDGGEPLIALQALGGGTSVGINYASSYVEDEYGNTYKDMEMSDLVYIRKGTQLTIKGKSGTSGSTTATVQVFDNEEQEYIGVPSINNNSYNALYTFTITGDTNVVIAELVYEEATESGTLAITLYRQHY